MREIICGIYKITSPSGSVYIGQSIDCHTRKRKYKNGGANSQSRLERSIKKYGWDAHHFEVIHRCEPNELDELEVFYIKEYNSFQSEQGLNLQSGGSYSRLLSEETKQKISRAHQGKTHSQETKKKIAAAGIGRAVSIETREKKSRSLKGKVRSDDHRKKLSIANTGFTHSLETRQKMSQSHTGKVCSETMRERMSQLKRGNINMLGKKHSEETKLKMRFAKLGKKMHRRNPELNA